MKHTPAVPRSAIESVRVVVVVDGGMLAVQQVKTDEFNLRISANLVAEFSVECGRGFRSHGIVFSQWAWSEVTKLQRAAERAAIVDDGGNGGDALDRTRYEITLATGIAKSGARVGKISIQRQPGIGFVVVVEFESGAATTAARVLGSSGITDVDDFRGVIQFEYGEGCLQSVDDLGSNANLLSKSSYQTIGSDPAADGHAARIVGMIAITDAVVVLGAAPRSEHHIQFGAGDEIIRRGRVVEDV